MNRPSSAPVCMMLSVDLQSSTMGCHWVLEMLGERLNGQRKWNGARGNILVPAEAEMLGFEEVDCTGTAVETVQEAWFPDKLLVNT